MKNLKRQKINDKDQNFHYLSPEKVKVSLYTQNNSSKVLDKIFNKENLKALANIMFEKVLFKKEISRKQEEQIVFELLSYFFDKSLAEIKNIKSNKANTG